MTISGGTPMRTGKYRAPKPARHDQVAIAFDNVPVGEAIAEARRHHRRIAEHAHLAAVRVSGKRERHALGHARKNIRLVRQQNHGRLICDLGERARQIIDAFEPAPRPLAAAADEGHLVAEPGQPERTAVLVEAHHVVLVDGDADGFQHAPAEHRALAGALGVQVVPPVVIAENGMHAERRPEDAQRIGPLLGSNRAGLELVAGGEVAQQHDDVGVELVGALGDGADALGRHQRTAGMHVGNDADAQIEAGRPSRRR